MPADYPSYLKLFETGELAARAERALDMLAECALCARQCRADRLYPDELKSYCRTGRFAYVSSHFAHHGEEQCLRGRNGSGTIFFSHCNLRCVFCQNYDVSWEGEGRPAAPDELAGMMLDLQHAGCHNINFVTPSHVVAQLIEALVIAAERGLRLPLVYNTGAYDRTETLQLLDGIVDIYMPDFKFWDPEISHQLARAPDYRDVACAAIKEMHRQVGDLMLDEQGLAVRGLLVRHLVMPESLAGTREVMRFLSHEVSPQTYVNVMAQYHPEAHAARYPTISRPITTDEYREAVAIAREEGITRMDRDP
jgi:putative pyruvate formate lyase activating enzyme